MKTPIQQSDSARFRVVPQVKTEFRQPQISQAQFASRWVSVMIAGLCFLAMVAMYMLRSPQVQGGF